MVVEVRNTALAAIAVFGVGAAAALALLAEVVEVRVKGFLLRSNLTVLT